MQQNQPETGNRNSSQGAAPAGSPTVQAADPHKARAQKIIHSASLSSAAVAGIFAQGAILGIDTLFLTPITLRMITSLGALFDKKITSLKGSSGVGLAFGVALGAGLARDIFGLCPGIGNLANAAITLAVTESLGWGAYRVFKEGGNPLDHDPGKLREMGAGDMAETPTQTSDGKTSPAPAPVQPRRKRTSSPAAGKNSFSSGASTTQSIT